MENIVITKASVSVSDAGDIEGVAWVFGSPDSVGDIIVGPVDFAKSVPMVREHNEGQVVGIWPDFTQDANTVTCKGRLFLDGIAPARAAREDVKKGLVTGLSMKFRPGRVEPNAHGGSTYYDITVSEISLCRRPVNKAARITVIKAHKDSPMEELEPNTEIVALETKIAELADVVKAIPTVDNTKLIDRLDKMEAKLNRPNGEAEARADVAEVQKAFISYLHLGNQAQPDVLKALTVSSDPSAGYLAPPEMSREFIRDLVEYSPIRSVASVRSTTAPSVKYPRSISGTNAKWEGELEESEESGATFGQIEIVTAKLTTFVDISNELLADSGGAAEAEVRLALAEDFGKKEAVAFVNGSGSGQPEGLMANADILHTVNGHATNLSTDKLIDLLYAFPAAYRNAPGFRWAMNGTTLAAVRKLKNTDGDYIWQTSLVAGQPETLLGKPVLEMVDLPDIANGAFPIIAGDFSAYRIVDRLALSILSDPYTQARRGVTRLHATRRTAGKVLQPARFRKLKTSAA